MNKHIKQYADDVGLYIDYDNRSVTDKEIDFFGEHIIKKVAKVARELTRGPLEGKRLEREILIRYGLAQEDQSWLEDEL